MGGLIEWAQQSISPKFPNFTFRKADIFNKCYNPKALQGGRLPLSLRGRELRPDLPHLGFHAHAGGGGPALPR